MRSSERRWRERGDGLHGDEIIDRRRDTSDLIGGIFFINIFTFLLS